MKKNDESKKIICLSANSDQADQAEIDSRFGRCPYFIVAEIENGKVIKTTAIENPGASQGHGAGISAGETVGKTGAEIIISGNFGPQANTILNQLNIKMHSETGKVKDIIDTEEPKNKLKYQIIEILIYFGWPIAVVLLINQILSINWF